MAQELLPISNLQNSTDALSGDEDIPLNIAGPTTRRVKSRLFALPTDPFVLFAPNGSLTSSRVITAGGGIVFNYAVPGQLIISAASGGAGPIIYGNRVAVALGAASVNNLDPPGWDQGLDKNGMSVTPFAGGSTITGIDTSSMVDGQSFLMMNMSDVDTVTLAHESGLSSANNRFHLPLMSDLSVVPGQIVTVVFETTTNRLRVSV